MHAKTPHAFARYVNPYLADLLQRLWLDKCFVRGDGCELIDGEGRRYLDCVAGYGSLPFGFNPPEVWQSLLEAQRGADPSFVQPSLIDAAGELAEQLIKVAPSNMRYVTFTNSGAESIEAAIKMCRAATGRVGILSTCDGFHGKTLGALSATGNPDYQQLFGAPAPGFHQVPFGDAEALREEFQRRPGYYAAFLVEPIQGEAGATVPPSGYLSAVRNLCTQAGILLILDEIQTGLGRTGALFACQAEGVQPDVMALGKALGGGLMPIGAVLASQRAYSERFALKHSSTFAGNALSCRAGLATLRLLTRDGQALIQRVAEHGVRLKDGLLELQRRYPKLISEVRGRGLLIAVRFAEDRGLWPESLLGVAMEQEFFAPIFASYLLNVEGIRVAPPLNRMSMIRVEPALTISWPQCEQLLSALERTLAMFATGDTGRIIASIQDRRARAALRAAVPPSAWVEVQPRQGEHRFAFLTHLLDYENAVDFDRSLGYLPMDSLVDLARKFTGFMQPFVLSKGRAVSKTGKAVYGEFIALPRTAKELAELPRTHAVAYVRGAVDLAKSRGAEMVGLGAFTSIVTFGGRAVSENGVPVTTGNSYTAVASAEAIRKALAVAGDPPAAGITITILGATGAIGRALAILLAEDASRLILVGNPHSPTSQVRGRLLNVASAIADFVQARLAEGASFRSGTIAAGLSAVLGAANTASPAALLALPTAIAQLRREGRLVFSQDTRASIRGAHVAVAATSATGAIVNPADLRRNAIVCDMSLPACLPAEMARTRPDVLVIDGGVIALPSASIFADFGMGEGLVYACMAETMLLTLAGRLSNTSIGADLSPNTLRVLLSLADEHGFRVAKLRSFGRPVKDSDLTRCMSRDAE